MTLRGLVQPGHEVVRRLWSRAPSVSESVTPLEQLEAAIAATRLWTTSRTPGAYRYGVVEASATANCLSWAAIVCAALRSRGTQETFVLLGSMVGRVPVETHAWVLTRDDDSQWYVADVTTRAPRAVDLPSFLADHDAKAVFNDSTAWLGAEERSRFMVRSGTGA